MSTITAPLLQMRDIRKSYPGVQALREEVLTLRSMLACMPGCRSSK